MKALQWMWVVLALTTVGCGGTTKYEALRLQQPERSRVLQFMVESKRVGEGAWTTLYYHRNGELVARFVVDSADMPSEFETETRFRRWLDPDLLEMTGAAAGPRRNAHCIVRNSSGRRIHVANVIAGSVRVLILDFEPEPSKQFDFAVAPDLLWMAASTDSRNPVGVNFVTTEVRNREYQFVVDIAPHATNISSNDFPRYP